jgi:pimeloyl-ACP methyl ester carboxylesterase
MGTYVVVAGGWGGGWEMTPLAEALRLRGHHVHTPTLSGLGDRAHVPLDPEQLTFSLHIEDVVQYLFFQDLSDIVLVGWSYGGVVVDGVADRVPERIRRVVNVDGGVAMEGQATYPEWAESAMDGWIGTPSDADLVDDLFDPALRAWGVPRLRPQPVGTLLEPFPDTGGRRHRIPHTYVRCSDDPYPEEAAVTQLRTDPAWQFTEVPLNHLGVLHTPDVIAQLIHDLD